MVQFNTRPANTAETLGALPLSQLEVFRQLGVKVITPAVEPVTPEPEITPEPVVEPEAVVEPTPAEPESNEPVEEATMEVAPETEKVATPISVLQLRKSYVTALATGNIETGNIELTGIGATAANAITEKLEAWQKEQNPTK